MDSKCPYCGADQLWDQERQRYICSAKCWRLKLVEENGLSEDFLKHYRILIRVVQRLRRDVAALKAINRVAFDAYLTVHGGGTQKDDFRNIPDQENEVAAKKTEAAIF